MKPDRKEDQVAEFDEELHYHTVVNTVARSSWGWSYRINYHGGPAGMRLSGGPLYLHSVTGPSSENGSALHAELVHGGRFGAGISVEVTQYSADPVAGIVVASNTSARTQAGNDYGMPPTPSEGAAGFRLGYSGGGLWDQWRYGLKLDSGTIRRKPGAWSILDMSDGYAGAALIGEYASGVALKIAEGQAIALDLSASVRIRYNPVTNAVEILRGSAVYHSFPVGPMPDAPD